MVPLLIIVEMGSNKFAAVVVSTDGLCPPQWSPVLSRQHSFEIDVHVCDSAMLFMFMWMVEV